MSQRYFIHTYNGIISYENLLFAWKEFLRGKTKKRDVQLFQYYLSDNVQSLHDDLKNKTYLHGEYHAFNISDPKPRNIHKASVRDRLLHHAIYRKLYPFFNNTFIADSYSCRLGKGTHKAMKRFHAFGYQVSQNHTKTVWVLKGDIRKFFASIDQDILIKILKSYIPDQDSIDLLSKIIVSFQSTKKGVGLPLGNLTSQLLVNIYMNKFDQFVKHKLKAKYYIRYADDFVIMSQDRKWLLDILSQMKDFLEKELHLQLHPDKVSIQTFASGVDFLGWIHFTKHRVLRTATKKRMLRAIQTKSGKEKVVASYLGMLGHGNTEKLKQKVLDIADVINN